MSELISFFIGLTILYIVGRILLIPLRILKKFLINGILGGISLVLFNILGSFVGYIIPINWFTSLIVGVLGIPGIILLLIL